MTRRKRDESNIPDDVEGDDDSERNGTLIAEPEPTNMGSPPISKKGRGITPDRNYRIYGRPDGETRMPSECIASEPTVGRARKTMALAVQFPVYRGWEMWIERCVRVRHEMADAEEEQDG